MTLAYLPKPSDDDPLYDQKMEEMARANPPSPRIPTMTCCRRMPWDCECPRVCDDCGETVYGPGLCGDCWGGR